MGSSHPRQISVADSAPRSSAVMLAATHLELAIFEGRGKISRNFVDAPLALEAGLGEEELPLLVLERQGAGAAGEAGGVEPLVPEQ